MATQAEIDAVKIQLPDEATDFGLTDTIIGSEIDSAGQTKAILFGLRAIAAKIASIEDVSESGSSRTVQFHNRVMAMIADWQARADAEDAATGKLPPKLNAKIHTGVRV
jgi:hypothetical protein